MGGWDIAHSNQTYNSGLYTNKWGWHLLWGGSALQAFRQSQQLWAQPLAVEMSLLAPGFAPWRGDMSPFSDEQRLSPSRGGDGMCLGGQHWVGQILPAAGLMKSQGGGAGCSLVKAHRGGGGLPCKSQKPMYNTHLYDMS